MSGFTDAFGNLGSFLGNTAYSGVSSGIGSFLNNSIGQLFQGASAKRQWKYQKKAMELQQKYNLENMQRQYDYQLDFWNKNNQYNDPSNAVARWRTSGVSPMSVFGSGSGGVGVSGGSVSAPSSDNPSASGFFGAGGAMPGMSLAEAAQMRNQQRLTDADVELKKAQADKLRGDTVDPDETKRGQRLENDLLEENVIGKRLANRISENDAEFSDYALGNRKKMSDLDVSRAVATNNKIIADTALSASQKELNEQSARESVARILQIEAQTALLQNQNKWYGKLTQAQIDSIYQGISESVNRMSLNDSMRFLNSAKEWNTMADTRGKELANWRQELANKLSGLEYGSGAGTDPSVTGELWYAVQKLFDLIHLFK